MMTRKHFLKMAGAGALALAGAPLVGCKSQEDAPSRGNDTTNWAWMGGGAPDGTSWAEQFGTMRAAGIEGVLLGEEDPSVLRTVAPIARKEGLELHVWHVTMRSGAYLEAHPDWYAVNRKGVSTAEDPPYVDYYRFLSPCLSAVRDALATEVSTLAQIDGVAGIQLDYIRFPDVILPSVLQPKYGLDQDREFPRFDYGYHPACRAQFEEQTGKDPLTLKDPAADDEWLQFRYDQITQVVRRLATAVHDHDKMISAAVFPTPDIARRLVRQEWASWPLDAVMPMVYHNFYEEEVPWIETAVREGVSALDPETPLYSGLYIPELPPDQLVEAVRHARAGGARGVALFSVGSMTDAHWEMLSTVLSA